MVWYAVDAVPLEPEVDAALDSRLVIVDGMLVADEVAPCEVSECVAVVVAHGMAVVETVLLELPVDV